MADRLKVPMSLTLIQKEKAKRHLRDFVKLFWSVIEPGTVLHWNWALDAVCDHLEAVTRGDIRDLLINIPPRYLKSTIVSVMWPAWEWLQNPEVRWLTASYDKTVRLWNSRSGETIQTLLGHSWWVWSAVFSPDARRIVTTGQDAKVIVWARGPDDADSAYRRETEFTGHRGPVYAAAFSPDGGRVVTGDYEGRVLIWNPDTVRQPEPHRVFARQR